MANRIHTAALTLCLLSAGAASLEAQVPAQPQVPVLLVNGEAQIRVAPDQATVRLGIMKQAPTADAAQQQANQVAQEILTAITKTGVSSPQIRTSRLTLTPISTQRRDTFEPPRIAAYRAQNVVTVTLQDLAKVGPTIDAGLKAGANELQGVSFEIKNDLAARQQALKQAVAEARKKAETMAEAMDIRLGSPMEVIEGGAHVMPLQFPYADAEMAFAAKAADMAPTPVSPGELEVRANVSIRYRIEAK